MAVQRPHLYLGGSWNGCRPQSIRHRPDQSDPGFRNASAVIGTRTCSNAIATTTLLTRPYATPFSSTGSRPATAVKIPLPSHHASEAAVVIARRSLAIAV